MKTTYKIQNNSWDTFFGNTKALLVYTFLLCLAGCIVVPQPTYTPATSNRPSSAYAPSNNVTPQESNGVNFQLFYDELSPYGTWVDYPRHGYVWVPFADAGFVPYSTRGHWLYTDAGWTWISDYNWGWAAFHYGRWDFDQQLGWFWVPDYQWGPAWVSWRRANGYYGWAPLTPGVSFEIAYSNSYNVPYNYWVFVNERDFDRPDVYSYYVNRSNNVTYINNSTVINNTYVDNNRHTTYYTGPRASEVQNATGRSYNAAVIRESDRPNQNASNGELRIYRPVIQQSSDKRRQPAPARVYSVGEASSSPRRNANSEQQINNNTNNSNVNPNTDQNNSNKRREGNNVNSNYQQRDNSQQNIQRQNTQPQNTQPTNTQPQNIQPQNTRQQNLQQPDNQPQNTNVQNENRRRDAVPQEATDSKSRNNPAVNQQQNTQPQPTNNPSISNTRREAQPGPKNETAAPKQDRKAVQNAPAKKTDPARTPAKDEKKENRRVKDN